MHNFVDICIAFSSCSACILLLSSVSRTLQQGRGSEMERAWTRAIPL